MSATPTAADFLANRVTNPAQSEVVRNRFYDYQLYPTAGASQISFFSLPVGQGITSALGGTVGSSKTQFDTNLEMGNTLPSGKSYLIESIEVLFMPGNVATANTYTAATVAQFNATASAAVLGMHNDVNNFYQSGMLELNILSKNYLRETPLVAFPPKAWISSNVGVASNAAATAINAAGITKADGRPYYVEPKITLAPAVNFEVLLRWPAPVATPSGFNARVGVILDGVFFRASQ